MEEWCKGLLDGSVGKAGMLGRRRGRKALRLRFVPKAFFLSETFLVVLPVRIP